MCAHSFARRASNEARNAQSSDGSSLWSSIRMLEELALLPAAVGPPVNDEAEGCGSWVSMLARTLAPTPVGISSATLA